MKKNILEELRTCKCIQCNKNLLIIQEELIEHKRFMASQLSRIYALEAKTFGEE